MKNVFQTAKWSCVNVGRKQTFSVSFFYQMDGI
uniref:Uncharacterized protein n=1 Tax=Anguilla anguilla TaxID=7936 RepID=A0A0E9UJJ6_ANGAN